MRVVSCHSRKPGDIPSSFFVIKMRVINNSSKRWPAVVTFCCSLAAALTLGPTTPAPRDGLVTLKKAAKTGAWREALALIRDAEGVPRGTVCFPLPIEAYNMAITACGSAGEWAAALGVLRSLTAGVPFDEGESSLRKMLRPRPDEVTFNAAGAAAARAGRWREAVQVVDQARRYGKPSPAVYTSAIAACGKARETAKAIELLDALRSERMADTRAYTAAIDACAVVGDLRNATRLFDEMKKQGTRFSLPNNQTYRAMTAAAARFGDFNATKKYIGLCERKGPCVEAALKAVRSVEDAKILFDMAPTYRGLVHFVGCCAAHGDWRTAEAAIQRMSSPAIIKNASPRDRRAVATQFIVALGRAGELDRAIEVLRKSSPDTAMYNAALVACRKAAEPTKALDIFKEMRHHDAISVAETVAVLERSSDFLNAERVLEYALSKSIKLKNGVLDLDNEIDLSGLPVPVAKTLVRRTLKKHKTGKQLVFITGIGAAAAAAESRRPRGIPGSPYTLNSILFDMLKSLGLSPVIPDDAPGTICVRAVGGEE